MAFSHVFVLSCLLYGVVAHRPAPSYPLATGKAPAAIKGSGSVPANSYLPPPKEIGSTGSKYTAQRTTATVNAARPAVGQTTSSGLSPSNSPSTKGLAGVRPATRHGSHGSSVPRLTKQKPIASVAGPNVISGSAAGAGRPIKSGRPTPQYSGRGVSRPTAQKPIVGARAPKTISSSGADRIIASGRKQSAKRIGVSAAPGRRTVGAHAPY